MITPIEGCLDLKAKRGETVYTAAVPTKKEPDCDCE
jgi:hypothetical protein